MEVASAKTAHRSPDFSLLTIGLGAIRAASLFEPGHPQKCMVLHGNLAVHASGLLGMGAVRQPRTTNAKRAPHRDAARLSGCRLWQRHQQHDRQHVEALGYKPISTTSHPAMMASRARSPLWTTNRMPRINRGIERKYKALKHATTRLTGGFEYIGPPMPKLQAKTLLNQQKPR